MIKKLFFFTVLLSLFLFSPGILGAAGSVSGRVFDKNGNGIANVNVNIEDLTYSHIGGSVTDSNGDYTVSGIPAGDYKVWFDAQNSGGFIGEWYNDRDSFENAETITVTDDTTLGGIDAQLTRSGSITGKVMDFWLFGIENVKVLVFDMNHTFIIETRTDDSGDYAVLGLSPGSYKVYFDTWDNGNFLCEWYSDKGDFDSAATILVTEGNNTKNINALLTSGGAVSGRVTDSSGNGLADAFVVVYDLDWHLLTSAYCDSNGYYTVIHLPAGNHIVHFTMFGAGSFLSEYYNDKTRFEYADTVTVSAGQTTPLADAVLEQGGEIRGQVTDGTAGLANVHVMIYDLNNNFVVGDVTDSSGEYRNGLIPTGNYKIYFDSYQSGDYVSEWYDDKSSFAEADQVQVMADQATQADAVLASGGIINGRVTDGTNGIENVRVYLYDLNSNNLGNFNTGSDGNYSFQALSSGNYKVYFDTGNAGNYFPEWYNNKDFFADADQVPVTAGQTTTLGDNVLVQGGIINGRVTDGTTGIGNVQISLYDLNSNYVLGGATDSNGNYQILGIPAGSFKICFNTYYPENYVSEWYNDKFSFDEADEVSVTVGETTTLAETVLTPAGIVSGRVTDGTNGIENVIVWVNDLANSIGRGVYTDSNGNYMVLSIPAGDYKVRFDTRYSANFIPGWYNEKDSFENADIVPVASGQTTTLADAVLAPGGIIAGRVTDGTTGLENVYVYLYDLNNNFLGSWSTNISGNYTIQPITSGNYKIFFGTENAGNYFPEWYNNKDFFADADQVPVTAGQTTTLADTVLAPAGSIAGRVTDGSAGIRNVHIFVYDLNSNYLVDAVTDSNGNYTAMPIPTGNYKVLFDTGYADNYVPEWYNDKGSFADADQVPVTVGQTTTLADAVLAPGGMIGGRVTDYQGIGIANVPVQVYDLNNHYLVDGNTDNNGNYSLQDLPPGDCKVYFGPNNTSNYLYEWYDDKDSFADADQVPVEGGQTTTLGDVVLAQGGIIGGRVTDGISGITNVNVYVYDLNNNFQGNCNTDDNGNYTIQPLPTGNYKVYFNTQNVGNFFPEWYNDKGSFAEADQVPVTAGQTSTLEDAVLAPSGGISGRVADESDNGIQGIGIYIYDLSYTYILSTSTDSTGNYSVGGIPGGSYKVFFRGYQKNYIPEWYNDKGTFENADPVTVTIGQTASQIDARLAPGGIITGRVTDAQGNGIANVSANVHPAENEVLYQHCHTDSTGNYTIYGVPAGTYKVDFTVYNVNFLPEWYNDKTSYGTADPVIVVVGQTNTLADAVLTEGGTIGGRVTDGTTGIANVRVYVYDLNNNLKGNCNTDTNGNYTIQSLLAGNYKVYFNTANAGNYFPGWYNDKTSFAGADQVPVTAGQTTPLADAVLIQGGAIGGRVTDSQGNGIENVTAYVYTFNNSTYSVIASGNSDSAGNYTVSGLPAGNYLVYFYAKSAGNYISEFYNDKNSFENADNVPVAAGQTTTLAEVVLATGAVINGRVIDDSANGIENVIVRVYDSNYTSLETAWTDSSGNYTVPSIPAGNCKVYFDTQQAASYIPEWYNDKGSFSEADTLTVTAGQTTPLAEVVLARSGTMSGRVTAGTGSGIQGVRVEIRSQANTSVKSSSTNADGNYSIQGLAAGTYKIYFNTRYATGSYLSEWYNHKTSFETGDTVEVTAGGTTTVDTVLAVGGTVTGRVANAAGTGLQNVRVSVYDLDGRSKGYTNTDQDGNYTVKGLVVGSYKVSFSAANCSESYISQWYDNKDSSKNGDAVTVIEGQINNGIDAVLAPGCTISGTVRDETSAPLAYIWVYAYGTGGNACGGASTDSSGNYQIKGLPPGSYKVWFYPSELNYYALEYGWYPRNFNYRNQWYNDKETFIEAEAVPVTLETPATGIDAVMTEDGGIISGRITDGTGSGIENCYVYVMPSMDNQVDWYDSSSSDAAGNYQVKGLPDGDYIVLFIPINSVFNRREFYNNTTDIYQATRVTVATGQTISGIDAVVEKGGIISGRVTDGNGNGLQNVWVRLVDAAANNYLGWVGNNVRTNSLGNYTLNAQAGQWKIMYQTAEVAGGYESEYYQDQTAVENAAVITLDPEQTITGIDAELTTGGGKISGYVKDTGNKGLYNVTLEVYDHQYKILVGTVTTGVDGYFEVPGLIPGHYKVYTRYNDVYPSEWYSDKTSYETAAELAVITGGNKQIEVVLGGPDPQYPLVRITSPKGGESLMAGTTHEITWTCTGANQEETVILDYTIDNGANWIDIVTGAANTGSYLWQVPNTTSEESRVRISLGDGDESLIAISEGVFTIMATQPTGVHLLSPNRWERLIAGTQQEITWTGEGITAEKTALYYSIDSGATWKLIVNGTTVNGSYQWTVPNTPSEHCLIRIFVGDGDNGMSDTSQNEFAIVTTTTPTISVSSPNGRETWKAGTIQTIQWSSTGTVGDVKIEYTLNGGGTWTEIIATTANTGSYEWTVPGTTSEECLVRVRETDGNPQDISDQWFSIVAPPAITITSPNGGESWEAGTTQRITWTVTGNPGNVRIEYTTDSGETWTGISTSASNTGGYDWTVPASPSENCMVRVGGIDVDEAPGDISDGEFSIAEALLLTVETPNGGERWKAGDTYAITWTAANLEGNVVVDLYCGDDFDFNIGIVSVEEGRIEWKIPGNFTESDEYRVLIHKDHTEDYSDTAFVITERKPNPPDFNNDGSVDIIRWNRQTGKYEVWYMEGVRRKGTGILPAAPGMNWRLEGTGDINRDGKEDLVWRSGTTGQNQVWYMDGIQRKGMVQLPEEPDVRWRIVGTGDFNGDGKTDIIWRHEVNGRNRVWNMDGAKVIGKKALPARENIAWQVVGAADFNEDGKEDILWRNVRTGRNEVWKMDGGERIGMMEVQEQKKQWQVEGTGDFNRDGHPDILWRRKSDGRGMVWYMDGEEVIGKGNIDIPFYLFPGHPFDIIQGAGSKPARI